MGRAGDPPSPGRTHQTEWLVAALYSRVMSRDTSETRALLLAAARDEFSDFGVSGARVDRIAAKAGVNKERIYGHFGNKEKLFEAVLVDTIDEHMTALGLPSGDLAEYVGRVYDSHRADPQLLRLFLWEALHYGEEAFQQERRTALYHDKVAALARTMGVAEDGETATTLLALIGLAAWPLAVPQLTRLIVGPTGESPDDIRRHLMDLVRKAVAPEAGG